MTMNRYSTLPRAPDNQFMIHMISLQKLDFSYLSLMVFWTLGHRLIALLLCLFLMTVSLSKQKMLNSQLTSKELTELYSLDKFDFLITLAHLKGYK